MLKRIAAQKKEEVKRDKLQLPPGKLIKQVVPGTMAFSKALTGKSWSLIAECKLASPVKGRLSERTVGELARIYDNEGAAALSVLTNSHCAGKALTSSAEKAPGFIALITGSCSVRQ